jgi:hypothetical protein
MTLQTSIMQLKKGRVPVLAANQLDETQATNAGGANISVGDLQHLLAMLYCQSMDAMDWWNAHQAALRRRLRDPTLTRISQLIDSMDFAAAIAAIKEPLGVLPPVKTHGAIAR